MFKSELIGKMDQLIRTDSDQDYQALLAFLDKKQKELFDKAMETEDNQGFYHFCDWYDLVSDVWGYKSMDEWKKRVLETLPSFLQGE